MRAFGGDPHTAHTTLAVVLDPLACEIFGDAFPDFGDPPFLPDWPEPTKLSRKGSITNLAGLTNYHQTLFKGTDGRRLATPAAELVWLVQQHH